MPLTTAASVHLVLASCTSLLVLPSCSAVEPMTKKDFFFEVLRGLRQTCDPVPLPTNTPFDAAPALRAAFLASFEDGYRRAVLGHRFIACTRGETCPARDQGWGEGQDAGTMALLEVYSRLVEPWAVAQ